MLEESVEKLHHFFGIREEFDLSTFSRGTACDVYLSNGNFHQNIVFLAILVVAEVTPGLSAECELELSQILELEIRFGKTNKTIDEEGDVREEIAANVTSAKKLSRFRGSDLYATEFLFVLVILCSALVVLFFLLFLCVYVRCCIR